jgi:hypothetical protein
VNVFYEAKYNLLVVRITAEGKLTDSKPCCMCINLMKKLGIKRVYYTDIVGNLCYQKVDSLFREEIYFSHGLKLMLQYSKGMIGRKIPLTRQQKTLIMADLNKN